MNRAWAWIVVLIAVVAVWVDIPKHQFPFPFDCPGICYRLGGQTTNETLLALERDARQIPLLLFKDASRARSRRTGRGLHPGHETTQ